MAKLGRKIHLCPYDEKPCSRPILPWGGSDCGTIAHCETCGFEKIVTPICPRVDFSKKDIPKIKLTSILEE